MVKANPVFGPVNVWYHLQASQPGAIYFTNLVNSSGANTGASLSIS